MCHKQRREDKTLKNQKMSNDEFLKGKRKKKKRLKKIQIKQKFPNEKLFKIEIKKYFTNLFWFFNFPD